MTLSDLENQVLQALSQPYANVGGAITWPTGCDFNQATVDFAINRTYSRLCSDLGDLELLTATLNFPSVTGQYSYTLQTVTGQPATAIGNYATGTITVSGTPAAGQVLTVSLMGIPATYTVPSASTSLSTITQGLIAAINSSAAVLPTGTTFQPVNLALNTYQQTTITLRAGIIGVGGNGISYTATGSGTLSLSTAGPMLTGGTPYNQPIRLVRRVWYQALGQLFRLELEPGARLISWEEFNRKTGAGYALPFSFTTWPDYATISPRRDHLYFYGAPSEYGDSITVDYCPIITSNTNIAASNWGYLVSTTDIPLLPEDAQDAIWMGAAAFLNPNSREIENGQTYMAMYKDEVQRIKDNYARDSAGDALVMRPAEDALASSGYGAWYDLG